MRTSFADFSYRLLVLVLPNFSRYPYSLTLVIAIRHTPGSALTIVKWGRFGDLQVREQFIVSRRSQNRVNGTERAVACPK
jgi:hypothetical protein